MSDPPGGTTPPGGPSHLTTPSPTNRFYQQTVPAPGTHTPQYQNSFDPTHLFGNLAHQMPVPPLPDIMLPGQFHHTHQQQPQHPPDPNLLTISPMLLHWDKLLEDVARLNRASEESVAGPSTSGRALKKAKTQNTKLLRTVDTTWLTKISVQVRRVDGASTLEPMKVGTSSKLLTGMAANPKKMKVNQDIFHIVAKAARDNDPDTAKLPYEEVFTAVETRFTSLAKVDKEKGGRRKDRVAEYCLKNPTKVLVSPEALKAYIVREVVSAEETDGDERTKVFRVKSQKFRATWLTRLLLAINKQEFTTVGGHKPSHTIKHQRAPLHDTSVSDAPTLLPKVAYNERWVREYMDEAFPMANDPEGFDPKLVNIPDKDCRELLALADRTATPRIHPAAPQLRLVQPPPVTRRSTSLLLTNSLINIGT
ncbi:hypothetical protein FA13DRAFT_1795580 [Coprinellus micaceus]|uniref:Uncharacterized protein n=1 Tax=Coprinellus micaceus TaxID=71717 RepID=A0A4Y7SXS5_COPMI|nr:hypothetical protein FA13DRAFT_1795580 [Coprinellus micaceus]